MIDNSITDSNDPASEYRDSDAYFFEVEDHLRNNLEDLADIETEVSRRSNHPVGMKGVSQEKGGPVAIKQKWVLNLSEDIDNIEELIKKVELDTKYLPETIRVRITAGSGEYHVYAYYPNTLRIEHVEEGK